MKIAIVGHSFTSERQWKLAEFIVQNYPGISVSLLIPRKWFLPTYRQSEEHTYEDVVKKIDKRVDIYPLPCLLSGDIKYYVLLKMSKILHRISPDILYVHSEPTSLMALHSLRSGKSAGCRCVLFTHENLYKSMGPLSKLLLSVTTKCYDFIVAASLSAKRCLIEKGVVREKIAIIPQTGIDTQFFKPNRSGEFSDGVRILYAGSLIPEKGVHVLLKAVDFMNKKGFLRSCRCKFLIYGRGYLRSYLEQYARRRGINHLVRFKDLVHYRRMPLILNKAEVFVYPSIPYGIWVEQFGFAVVEAMACGLPVVTTECGALPELVKHEETGFVVPPNDYVSLAHALLQIIENPDMRYRMGKAARMRAESQFSLKAVSEKVISLFRRLLEK